MAENTEISWCDHTFNPWWGCTKVSPGCDHCYAEAWDRRFNGNHWGKDASPRTMSADNWRKPKKWNKKQPGSKVFCGSMCDVFDNKAPEGQREKLWELIRETPDLNWLLLTKRAPNIKKYLPDDWEDGYSNVWLGVSVENKKHGFPRMDILRGIPAAVKFISAEPLLEDISDLNLNGFDWVIGGGESGPNCRLPETSWMHGLEKSCSDAHVPFWFKQWGGNGKDKGGHEIGGRVIHQSPLHYIKSIRENLK